MLIKTRAIVISAIKYGDADLIVKAYTLADGLKTYMIRGVLKSKRGKFRASMFQSLTQLDIIANHKGAGKLEFLKDAKVASAYRSIYHDPIKMYIAMFLAEMLKNTVKEEEGDPALFHFLEYSLEYLDASDKIANFHLLFLLNLTKYLGFMPEKPNTDMPVFNLLEGVFQFETTNDYCISGNNVEVLKDLLGINFEAMHDVKLNQNTRNEFLNMLLLYYELHIEGFHKPKSLTILNEIFS